MGKQLGKYLSDVHAIESQSLQLLEQGPAIAIEPNLKKVFEDHLEETRSQRAVVESLLETRGERPSRFKNVVMRVGAEWAESLLPARVEHAPGARGG